MDMLFEPKAWLLVLLASLLGASIVDIQPGAVTIKLPFAPSITQQLGFVHAGAITTIADTACGYAALSLMPADSEVMSVEYKVNFLSPAKGVMAVAIGRVIRPGRTLTICQGDVYMVDVESRETLCATMLSTTIRKEVKRG